MVRFSDQFYCVRLGCRVNQIAEVPTRLAKTSLKVAFWCMQKRQYRRVGIQSFRQTAIQIKLWISWWCKCRIENLQNLQEILELESAMQCLNCRIGADWCSPFSHKTLISIRPFHRYNFEHRKGVAEMFILNENIDAFLKTKILTFPDTVKSAWILNVLSLFRIKSIKGVVPWTSVKLTRAPMETIRSMRPKSLTSLDMTSWNMVRPELVVWRLISAPDSIKKY